MRLGAMPETPEHIVWKWAHQFSYKLNISDDKIEELNRQVNDALRTATASGRRETWEEAANIIAGFDQMTLRTAEQEFRRRATLGGKETP